jgi:phage-related protein
VSSQGQVGEAFVRLVLEPGTFERDLDRAVEQATAAVQAVVEVQADASAVAEQVEAAAADAAPVVEVDADASAIPAAVDEAAAQALPIVDVDADVAPAEAALAQLEASAPEIEVEVTIDPSTAAADVGNLSTQFDRLGSAAGAAGDDLDVAGRATSGLNVGTGLALGSVDALGDVVGKMGAKAAGAAGGVIALAGFTQELFTNALDAEAATFRFEQTLGEMAGAVEQIDVGGLNESIGDLALRLGSGDDEIRQVVASFFELGTASGRSAGQVAESSEQLVALAARARALNPQLGSVDQIAQSLQSSLARGGRTLAQFGISLTAAEIEARALADTGKDTSDELTQFDKAAAGAAIASERLGDSLATDIAKGAESPALALDKLTTQFSEFLEGIGAPLVAPILDFLEELEPIAEEFAGTLGELLEAVAPLLPPLGTFARVFVQIHAAPIRAAAAALDFLVGVVTELADAFGFLLDKTGVIDLISNVAGAVGDAAGAVGGFFSDIGGAIGGFFDDGETKIEPVRQIFDDLAGTLTLTTGEVIKFSAAEQAAAEEAERLHRRVLDTDVALGRLRLTSRDVGDLLGVIRETGDASTGALEALAVAADDAQLAQQGLQDVADVLGVDLDDLEGFISDVTAAIDDLASQATGSLPSASTAIDEVVEALGGIPEALDPQAVIDALQRQIDAIAGFQANLQLLATTVGPNLAALAAAQGPQITQALVNGITQGGPEIAGALEESLGALRAQGDATTDFINDEFSPQVVEDLGVVADSMSERFEEGFQIAPTVEQELDGIRTFIEQHPLPSAFEALGLDITGRFGAATAPIDPTFQALLDALGVHVENAPLPGQADTLGGATADAFAGGLGTVAPETQAIIDGLGPLVNGGIPGMQDAGFNLGAGIGDGIAQSASIVASQVRSVVQSAESAAKEAAHIRSPSQLFADEIGVPIAQGIAEGIDAGTATIDRALAGALAVPNVPGAAGTAGAGMVVNLQASVNVNAAGLDGRAAFDAGRAVRDGLFDDLEAQLDRRLARFLVRAS